MRYYLCLLYMTGLLPGFAQSTYSVADIPEGLKSNSLMVVRLNHVEFVITAKNKATRHVHEVQTILSPKAKRNAYKAIFYDKQTKLTSLKANVYDQYGALIKKMKLNDFDDVSAITGFSLFEDNRVKVADLAQQDYPYTVEIEYELAYNYLFDIPTFYPTRTTHTAVERASYTLKAPPGLKPRYKAKNIANGEPNQLTAADGSVKYQWGFENMNAVILEEHGPSFMETLPHVMAGPTQFEYAGYAGSMESWDNFGDWIISLNKGRDLLTQETIAEVKSIVEKYATVEERAKALYELLQRKTRYVSIQLGIGGFQPFEAKVVDQVGYGDCKALSNYMIALLKEAGIKTNYVLIRAGEDKENIDTDFPSTQFNHVIVAVPNKADTIWLECTSQSEAFGYLSSFTADRHALSVSEEGSRIVRTPKVAAHQNFLKRNATIHVASNGSAMAQVAAWYSGLECETNGLNFIDEDQLDEQQNWIIKNTPTTFKLGKYSFKKHNANPPQVLIEANLNISRYATVSGKRLFISPNILNKSSMIVPSSEERATDFKINKSYIHKDSIAFVIPEGLYPETIPPNKHIINQFGEYKVDFIFDNGKVTYIRKLKMNEGRFPANTYKDYGLFIKEIIKADNIKLVLLNRT